MKDIVKEIIDYAKKDGTDLIGFSRVEEEIDFLREENRSYFIQNGLVNCISLARRMSYTACEFTYNHNDPGSIYIFTTSILKQAEYLENTSQNIVEMLENAGYKAVVISGRGKLYNDGGYKVMLSHGRQFVKSGLGAIGDSGLMLTEEYGPRVRIGSVLTNCTLPIYQGPAKEICIHCGLCAKICPSGAIKEGVRYDPSNSRKSIIEYDACFNYRKARQPAVNSMYCDLCVAVCPVGKRNDFSCKTEDISNIKPYGGA